MKAFLALIACGICLTATAQPSNPAADLAAMQVAEGYEVNLFASEREGVVKPIQIRFDPAGRLWVIGSVVYPQIEPGQIPNDKVVVLEDTDGDGRADKSQVFAEGLMIPTGIELGDGGVYIGQGTTLLHLRDTDADGKADERRVVLRGFGTGDSHQTINSFTWGPGGELMMCQGLHALSRVETPWGIEQLHSAGVWRLWPRTLRLDPFLNEEMGPQNPFGIAFDRWGAVIMAAGNGQGMYYLTPAMIRAPKKRTLPSLWNTGRKFAGGDFVENSHFPADAQGQFITGSYLNNSVYRFRVTEDGSGFRVNDLPPLVASTNTAFRIVDARFGPDGAFYLCDWHNPIIGHYQASFRHPDRDKKHGRIWRVTAKGRPLATRRNLEAAPIPALLEALKSAERWDRQMANRALANRPKQEVTGAVAAWARQLDPQGPNYEQSIFEAVAVLQTHAVVDPQLLDALMQAKDYHARAYAPRVIGHLHQQIPDTLQRLGKLVTDAHPRVRLEAIIACSYVQDPKAVEIALRALGAPVDTFIDYSLSQTIHTLKPAWLQPFKQRQLDLSAKALESLVKTDASADTLGVVRQLFTSKDVQSNDKRAYARIIAEVGSAEDLQLLLQRPNFASPAEQAAALAALRESVKIRKVRPAGAVSAALQELIGSNDATLRAQALLLAAQLKEQSFLETTRATAQQKSNARPLRLAAVEALGFFGDKATLEALLSGTEPGALRAASIVAFAELDLPSAARHAAQEFAGDNADVEQLLPAFLRKQGGPAALAEELQRNAPSKNAAQAGLTLMAASGKRAEQLTELFNKALSRTKTLGDLSPDELKSFATEVRSNGNAERGRAIYERQELGCVACHAIGGVGGTLGPDLLSLGTAQSVEFIIGAILEPNKEVKEGFVSTTVVTKDGSEQQGYVLRQNAQEVALRMPGTNEDTRIARSDIKEMKQLGSIMPERLCDSLSRDEFRDLVRFLSELGVKK
ncbi:MAG TPA: PVC-type heme-binding CxxCH protein [Methylomirabilota bacterium]|nr:PVC-type heme-binding CxxCH protein [Methylomirabilota bacterium]